MAMNRRDLIKSAGMMGMLGMASAVAAPAKAADASEGLVGKGASKFILVHGAFHGGWCYGRVAALLRKAGHQVWTPSLSGMAENAHQFSGSINLSTHIEDIVRLIDVEDIDDAVLCGHSYGGMVIAGVADKRLKAIRSIVYLDAFMPADGQSLFDLDAPGAVQAHLNSAANNGGYTIPPIPSSIFRVNEADQAYVDSKCTAQPLATFSERIKLGGDYQRVAKKTFVYAEGWKDISPFGGAYEKAKTDSGFVTHKVPCGHDVMIDMPEHLAKIVVDAV